MPLSRDPPSHSLCCWLRCWPVAVIFALLAAAAFVLIPLSYLPLPQLLNKSLGIAMSAGLLVLQTACPLPSFDACRWLTCMYDYCWLCHLPTAAKACLRTADAAVWLLQIHHASLMFGRLLP